MSPAANQRSQVSPVLLGIRWLALLLALYVLSTGPVQKLHDADVIPGRAMTVYAPLESLCEYVPPIEAFFMWYIYGVWRCYFISHYP
jgi:hypothetical protein